MKPYQAYIWYDPLLGHIKKEDEKMENDGFHTVLKSYKDCESKKQSRVEINCKNFETFKAIVEAIMPILEKEEK